MWLDREPHGRRLYKIATRHAANLPCHLLFVGPTPDVLNNGIGMSEIKRAVREGLEIAGISDHLGQLGMRPLRLGEIDDQYADVFGSPHGLGRCPVGHSAANIDD